jgi:hypothetical protein
VIPVLLIGQLCSFQGPAGGANRTRVPVKTGTPARPVSQNSTACVLGTEAPGVSSRSVDIPGTQVPRVLPATELEAQRAAGRRPVVAPVKELPRKEVIQPQLPLRLPCYDFTPITSPTFDGCLP